ncbi:MAG: hypothetical protein A2Z20_00215 [Bdellovibrionales bacterium RBG_16_40_8]|nr:MAG: hypothetical protein A2Z20_00215 [Bdellovibrionales bacterium RBG_16_40_8]
MRKSFLKKKKAGSGEVALQITSMADIFMILLVFLIKNYAASATNIAPTARLSLPEVTKGTGVIRETLKVEISKDAIIVDQIVVAKLKNFEFDIRDGGENEPSLAVVKALNEQRKLLPEPNMDSSVLVMADQNTPYATLKRVVASAAGSGFVDMQLVVVETE